MKKIITLLLTACLMGTMNLIVWGESNELVPRDPISILEDGLSENDFAGSYVNEDGKICLTVTNKVAVQKALSKARNVNSDSVVLEQVKYSLNDLEMMKKDLLDKATELKITAAGLDPEINGLAIYMEDPSEENKALVIAEHSVDMVFYSNTQLGYPDNSEPEALPEIESRATTLYAGRYLSYGNDSAWSSVGYKVKKGTQYGYITCGHGWNTTDTVKYGSETIGTISLNRNGSSGNVDASFIPSSLPFGGLRQDGLKASYSGSPSKGSTVIMDGARHYQEGLGRMTATIQALSVDIPGGTQDLFVFDQQPIPGDSGAAILQLRPDGKYTMIGINKGQYYQDLDKTKPFTWGTGCKWTNIASAFGVTLVNT